MGNTIKFAFLFLFTFLMLAANPVMAGYKEGLKFVSAGKWSQALKEFEPMADEGHAASQFSIGLIYQLGRGVSKDMVKARQMYLMSAKQGYWPAYNNLGKMFLNGDGVPKSHIVAFRLFSRASDNHAQARSNLARMYENGWGVGKDIEKATELYGKSGDDGYIQSYFRNGEMYSDGKNTSVDTEEAIKWYQKAADKNHKEAIKKLEELGG